ncbi:MAG: hypothetical protein JRI23_05250, partial [Deltaproteobacteria bacterium]|nr:hypothetical protein [Deltaproteobacteria bacterium]MBW2530958.1 hypothetical protein [Deltaproteobacteria bacterium]
DAEPEEPAGITTEDAPGSQPPAADTGRPDVTHSEADDLYRELVDGSFAAGEYLLALIEAGDVEGRSSEVLEVRRHQAKIRRGDPDALARLEEAARADHNEPYARAVHHVRHAFDEQEPAQPAPPLSDLTPQPELTTRLLFSSLATGVNEALAIVMNAKVLRRPMDHYGLSGADRVSLSASSPIGRVFAALSGLLEAQGTRLFHPTRTGPLRSRTALLTPTSIIVEGKAVQDTPRLRYVLGNALAAAMPPFALVDGLSRDELELALTALLAGFGPVGAAGQTSPEQMRMAEDLWHVVSPAEERRLREICAEPDALGYDLAHDRARRACRRAGLFASGHLPTAIRQAVAELELDVRARLDDEGALAELCDHPAIADLVDLAILPEYAEIRWHHQPQSLLRR